jgi:hypothetical protein
MVDSAAINYFFNPAINDYFLERHDFKFNGCHAFFRKVTAEEFGLDDFRCDKHTKGDGRKLLLYGLEWLKTHFPNVKTLSLTAVPSITFEKTDNLFDKQKKRELGQRNLNKYYTNLGFNAEEENANDFIGNIDDIIAKIKNYKKEGGGTKRQRKNKNKRKTLCKTKMRNKNAKQKCKTKMRKLKKEY